MGEPALHTNCRLKIGPNTTLQGAYTAFSYKYVHRMQIKNHLIPSAPYLARNDMKKRWKFEDETVEYDG